MNTSITRSDRRLKLLSTEESHKAGNYDAETLLVAIRNANEGDDAAGLLADGAPSMVRGQSSRYSVAHPYPNARFRAAKSACAPCSLTRYMDTE